MLEYSEEHGCVVDRGKIGHKGGAVVDVAEEKTWLNKRWRSRGNEAIRELARARRHWWRRALSDAAHGRLMALREDRREEVVLAWGEEGPPPVWVEVMRAEALRRVMRRRRREVATGTHRARAEIDRWAERVSGVVLR